MKVYIATLPNGFFGSTGQSWQSLDINKVSSLLNFDSEIITINDLMHIDFDETDIVFYTSSDEENIRLYLRDVMYFINKKCRIIPSYDILMSHENKGFQELYRTELGFGNLKGNYFFDIDDCNLPLPKVLKTVSGSGSSGVFLVKNEKDLLDIKKKHFNVSNKRKVIKFQRKIKLQAEEFSIYNYRHKGFNRFVEQDFIPNLTNDFKILVFGDRYYSLKRNIKEGDFRASGSGLFEHVKPPKETLDYAKSIFDEMNNPYASLDIAQSPDGCHLIEFQGTNFSPGTLLKAPSRYVCTNGEWVKEKNNQDLEENFAYALNFFMKSNESISLQNILNMKFKNESLKVL
ncbi:MULTISPECIES: ATP-grasp domain-containing protein [unclassified Psychrobacter]|uniref:ATP-grasp domain-containing protein n=1 Tax=unclassified Psychrobacter TaxID=196806 RepID=UPI003F4504C6